MDTTSFKPTYLGANCFSPYEAIRHPSGDIYVCGYANKVMRYNPLLPWTLSSASSTPRLPSDRTKPNPYFIKMSGDLYHYRQWMDYDANGIVWVGGNTTRGNPDYGNVMWYNPHDGSVGYLFPGWKIKGTLFRNLCAANHRKRLCVSDNAGNIWIIDADRKKVDPAPIVPLPGVRSKTYMVEARDDQVFGIVFGSDSVYKVIKFKPSTKQVLYLQDVPVPGIPFGFGDNKYDRMNYKLELGPDGYIWMFVGNTLYQVDPDTCAFNKVVDTPKAKLKFSPNNVDLMLYYNNGGTDFKYIPGLMQPVP